MKTVFDVMGLRHKVSGDVGIEIEVEGSNLPICEEYWNNEKDGSLKGLETAEYVLRKPTDLDGVVIALEYLSEMYKACGTKVDDTVRAGVHIHINCQKLTMVQLYTFMTVYLVLENVLVRWCGPSREGNLFCLRASDAEGVLTVAREAAISKKFRACMFSDDIRYASMNMKALGNYGSLEFRAMRGTDNFNLIYKWASILYGLKEFSKNINKPIEVIEQFSVLGPTGFMKWALGDNYDELSCEDEEKLLWEGARNAQDIAFCTNWDEVDPRTKFIGQIEFLEKADPDEPEEDF